MEKYFGISKIIRTFAPQMRNNINNKIKITL